MTYIAIWLYLAGLYLSLSGIQNAAAKGEHILIQEYPIMWSVASTLVAAIWPMFYTVIFLSEGVSKLTGKKT